MLPVRLLALLRMPLVPPLMLLALPSTALSTRAPKPLRAPPMRPPTLPPVLPTPLLAPLPTLVQLPTPLPTPPLTPRRPRPD